MSDSGLVAGRADFSSQSTNHHAFLWKNGVMTDLGVVDPWPCSTAYSFNSKGQVVGDTGICGQGGGPSFFSEHGEPMVDINTLVLPGSDIEVIDAFTINERGEIAGTGLLPNGDKHARVGARQRGRDCSCDYPPCRQTSTCWFTSSRRNFTRASLRRSYKDAESVSSPETTSVTIAGLGRMSRLSSKRFDTSEQIDSYRVSINSRPCLRSHET